MPNTLKWLGHSSWQITTSRGQVLFIDPWLSKNPLAPVTISDLPAAGFILLTHDHGDHAGDCVEVARQTGATLVAQPETVARYKTEGLEAAIGMNIGGSVDLAGVTATMVDAFHTSETGVASGFILTMEDGKVLYHAGDTGLHCNMELWGSLFAIDVALVPIGGHYTMDGRQAAHALRLLKPRRALPMHYRTFPVLAENAEAFVAEAAGQAPQTAVEVIEPGEHVSF